MSGSIIETIMDKNTVVGKKVSYSGFQKMKLGIDTPDPFESDEAAPRRPFKHVMEFQKARGSAQISIKQFDDICRMSWTDVGISNLLEQLLIMYKLKGGEETSTPWDDPDKLT